MSNKRDYAQAIYEIAKEENLTKDFLDISLAIIDAYNNEQNLQTYMSSTSVTHEEKKELVKELTNDYQYYMNWLFLAIDAGKSKYIKHFINEYINLYNQENNIVKGYAWTTTPLDQSSIKKIEKATSKKINKEVMIENKIDKEIIGGIKLEIGDDIWDNSIKNKLLQLLKEGSEG